MISNQSNKTDILFGFSTSNTSKIIGNKKVCCCKMHVFINCPLLLICLELFKFRFFQLGKNRLTFKNKFS